MQEPVESLFLEEIPQSIPFTSTQPDDGKKKRVHYTSELKPHLVRLCTNHGVQYIQEALEAGSENRF